MEGLDIYQIASKTYFLLCYLITLVISIKYYYKYFDTKLKYLPLLLAYTLLNEILGALIRYSNKFAFIEDKSFANDVIYNIFDIVYFAFFYLLYFKLVNTPASKRFITIISILVGSAYITNSLFFNPLTISLYWASSLSSLALVTFVLCYFREITPINNWDEEKYNLMVWISLGILVFHSFFPFLFLSGYLLEEYWNSFNFHQIILALIVIMNIFFCIGFIKSRRRAFR